MTFQQREITSKFTEGEPDEGIREKSQEFEGYAGEKGAGNGSPEDEDWDSSEEEEEGVEDADNEKEGMKTRPVPEELLTTDPATGLSDQEVKSRQRKYGKVSEACSVRAGSTR
jgi:hypothetical protein